MPIDRKYAYKLILSGILLSQSILVLIDAILPIRGFNDEIAPYHDIGNILVFDSIGGGVYPNGNLYQIQTASLLRVTGLELNDLQLLSPYIGGLVLGLIVVSLYLIVRRVTNVTWYASVPLICVPFMFPGFLNRIRMTSHKQLTIGLVFVLISVVFKYCVDRRARLGPRWFLLYLVLALAIAMSNYIWAVVYITPLVPLLVADRHYREFGRSVRMVAIPYLFILLSTQLPTIRKSTEWFRFHLLFPLLGRKVPSSAPATDILQTQTSGATGPLGKIALWPAISVADIQISMWWIFTSGTFFVSLCTVFGVVGYCIRSYRNKTIPIDHLFISITAFSGLLFTGLIFVGGLATYKRIIFMPGAVTAAYWVYLFERYKHSISIFQIGNTTVKVIAVIGLLVLLSVAGIPKAMPNDSISPYDKYTDEADYTTAEWYVEHSSVCTYVDNRGTSVLLKKEFYISEVKYRQVDATSNNVYVNGGTSVGHIDCQPNS